MTLIWPNVHLLPEGMGGNVYLLADDTLTLVDAGMPGGADGILDYVRGIGRAPAELTRIILTHHHVDHVGSAAALEERTGATVFAHADDAPIISGQEPHPPPRRAIHRVLFRLVPMMSRFVPVTPDELVEDGSVLDVLGGATVIHVPGHTPGAIALHLPGRGVLFSGDAVGNRWGRLGPPPPAFTSDSEQAIESIRRMAQLDFDVLCPGHGPPLAGGAGDRVREMVAAIR